MIKRAIQSTLKMFGCRLTRAGDVAPPPVANPNWSLDHFFPLMKGFGFDPMHILDIGANKGAWTREAAQYFPQAHYTLVEPQDELKLHIQDLADRVTILIG